MNYGSKPKDLGEIKVDCSEMMFYQYLPIKLIDNINFIIEDRMESFRELITLCCYDFIREFGFAEFKNHYCYLTVKRLYQGKGYSFNRKGYHSDGFMTPDINYLWSDALPTVFNFGQFNLSQDDELSSLEMEAQAKEVNEFRYPENSLLRLDQFVIHKVSEEELEGVRAFIKISFSKDRYDLKGNSKNHLLDYDWEMRERNINRNIPQNIKP